MDRRYARSSIANPSSVNFSVPPPLAHSHSDLSNEISRTVFSFQPPSLPAFPRARNSTLQRRDVKSSRSHFCFSQFPPRSRRLSRRRSTSSRCPPLPPRSFQLLTSHLLARSPILSSRDRHGPPGLRKHRHDTLERVTLPLPPSGVTV